MTNDTSKLDGALMELGDTMADNLVAMGVSGASAADGLTTLANNILDIAPSVGGITPTVSIDLSKSPTLICRGATVDIMALVHADYDDTSQTDVDLKGYLQGATVTFKNGNDSIGYAVSDNDGIATLVINDIAMGNYSIVGSFDGTGTDYESATSSALTFTVNDYPTITLSADKTNVTVGETVTFTITAEYNNTPVVGYPIQLYKDGSSMGSLYAGLTNSNGEATITYAAVSGDDGTIFNANTLSNSITLELPVFSDDCSTDKTSDYTYISTRNSSTATLTFNSNGYYEYTLTKTSSEGFIAFPLAGVASSDTIQIEYDVYKEDGTSNTFGNIGGLTVYEDDSNWATQKGNSPPDNKYYWGKKTNGSFSEGSANYSFPSAQTWVHVTATLTGTSLSIVFDVNGTTYSRTLTVNTRSSNTKFGIPISWICSYPNTVRLKNIVVKKITT